jgi:hypothetical protein
MTTITLETIERIYANNGQHAEQVLAYTLTHEIRKHDRLSFDEGSDIPEYHMSVKSSRATLMSGKLCTKDTKEGIIEEFFQRTASEWFAYVIEDFSLAYVMNKNEFYDFCSEFGRLTTDSSKNGGKKKVQFCQESGRTRMWLASRV